MRILLVDDDSAFTRSFERLWRRSSSVEIVIAADLASALGVYQNGGPFNAVITDLDYPAQEGADAVAFIGFHFYSLLRDWRGGINQDLLARYPFAGPSFEGPVVVQSSGFSIVTGDYPKGHPVVKQIDKDPQAIWRDKNGPANETIKWLDEKLHKKTT